MSRELANNLRTLKAEELEIFHNRLIGQLREMTGDHRRLEPFHPNFPSEVRTMPEAELYLNALYHYLTLEPNSREASPRPELLERSDIRQINLGTATECDQIFTFLCSGKSSLSQEDQNDLIQFITTYGDDIVRLLPAEFPMKENMAFVGAELLKRTQLGESFLASHIKTATDVLRVAVASCDGDISLAEPCRFTSLSRSHRKLFLSLLEKIPNPAPEMGRWKNRWLRLGERLHPGEYAKQFPQSFQAFSILRNRIPYESENSHIEALCEQKDVNALVELLVLKPGIFARRLDHLLRMAESPDTVLDAFESISKEVSTTILLRMASHFDFRERQHDIEAQPFEPSPTRRIIDDEKTKSSFATHWLKSLISVESPTPQPPPAIVTVPNELIRVFLPKGKVAKVFARPAPLPLLPRGVAIRAADICREALRKSFAAKEQLGSCWIDPNLKNYRIPTAQRSASKSLRTLTRGSRLPLPDTNTLRFFIWWMNGLERTDLDLSAAFYDNNFSYIDAVSYYNLKNFRGYHSGDIVDAPEGAAEFIDIDIEKTRSKDVRYVVMILTSFTSQPYCDLPECFAGWMARKEPNSGEVFEARTVKDKIDIASDTRIAIPLIFDLEKKEAVWCDLALQKTLSYNNVLNNLSGVSLMVRSMVALQTPTLHQLFTLHAEARGSLTEQREKADTIFAVEGGDTSSFNLEKISAEFL